MRAQMRPHDGQKKALSFNELSFCIKKHFMHFLKELQLPPLGWH